MAGRLFVISGPSGVGKGSVVKRLLGMFADEARPQLSVSVTTRQPREGEIDGCDYFFWTKERFREAIEQNAFLEWAEVFGNYYGTPDPARLEHFDVNRDFVFEIDVQGALQIRRRCAGAVLIFIDAPPDAVESRLRGRGKDDEAAIARRLSDAAIERAMSVRFDHIVVNDQLELAAKRVFLIICSDAF